MSRFQPTRILTAASLAVLAAGLCLQGPEAYGDDKEAQLKEVRGRLERLRESVESDTRRRDRLSRDLRDAEKEVSDAARKLEALRGDRRRSEQRLAALRREARDLEGELSSEQRALAGQIRAAYVNGRHEQLKLLLNQQDPASLGRMMSYYRYFNGMRATTIDRVSTDLERLAVVEQETEAETREIQRLEGRQSAQLANLQEARTRRAGAVETLNKQIRDRGEEIERLETQAATLEKLVEELRRALRDFPVDAQQPFKQWRGRLSWPVAGKLIRDYGQPRAGGRLKWRGVLVGASRGTEVRAIYHGRVAYADWLPGLGLLLILEHGDGYLSLYGHNETLYKAAGEWVAPGEVIASVGDSGGQGEAALYFEIRQGTKPQNPHRWFGKKLASR